MRSRRIGAWAMLAAALALAAGCGSSGSGDATWRAGQPLTIDVSATFPAGTVLRDASSGATATVAPGGTATVTPDASGVVLLEREGAGTPPFSWKGATVYFAMTDRFANGDPGNDHAYGRTGDGASEVGTWHGGDWKGLTARLDHVAALGATALWISPIVEQVHGWVGGGTGDFKHYGYHGYWALDFTRLDASFGTLDDLRQLIDEAHRRGLRVVVDVVMNHPGYATGDDLAAYLPEVFFDGTGDAFRRFQPSGSRGWQAWNDLVNYNSDAWRSWWSPSWIRASFPGFTGGGTDDLTRQLSFLPDFRTESAAPAGVPTLFERKRARDGTEVAEQPGYTVRQYLVKWHTDWVRQLGIDGFRCDTAKNVELASWRALKDAGVAALADWKARNPDRKLDDAPFWTVGEAFGHGVQKDDYYASGGFDALLNFEFQPRLLNLLTVKGSLLAAAADLDALWARYAQQLSADPEFDALSYLSSHDTLLFFDSVRQDGALQRQAGTALLLSPGGIQVFYGDETGRPLGPSASDSLQGTRSDMNWASVDTGILAHWQKLGQFRKRHPALGAGQHRKLSSPAGTYAFARALPAAGADAVVVALTPTP